MSVERDGAYVGKYRSYIVRGKDGHSVGICRQVATHEWVNAHVSKAPNAMGAGGGVFFTREAAFAAFTAALA